MEGLIFGILRFLLLRTVIFQKAIVGCLRLKGDKTQFQLAGLELSILIINRTLLIFQHFIG